VARQLDEQIAHVGKRLDLIRLCASHEREKLPQLTPRCDNWARTRTIGGRHRRRTSRPDLNAFCKKRATEFHGHQFFRKTAEVGSIEGLGYSDEATTSFLSESRLERRRDEGFKKACKNALDCVRKVFTRANAFRGEFVRI